MGRAMACAVPVGADLASYRSYHLQHHRFAQQPEDPDLSLSAPFPISKDSYRRKAIRDLSGQTFVKQRLPLFLSLFKPAAKDVPVEHESFVATGREKTVRFLGFNALLFVLFWLCGAGIWYVGVWLVAMATWLSLVTRIRNIAEHACRRPARTPFTHARTTLANRLERPSSRRIGCIITPSIMSHALAVLPAPRGASALGRERPDQADGSVATAQAFLDGVGYDGVVLTKLDGDARGGAALSIAELTGRPVMFASSGEKLEDFDVFHPDRMASRILDMGDMLTLIEQAERAFDEDQAASMAGKLASGEGFTLEDFVEQLAMVRKLGPIGNLLGMLPGAGQNRELLSQISDKDLDRAAAIVNSMTPAERRNPKILNGSRRSRIANGSGVTVGEVNNLVVRFLEGQKMMRQMMGGGGMPGMPAIPGMRRAATKSAKGKKNNKKKPKGGRPGGNPAAGKTAAKASGAPQAGNGAGPALPGPGLGGSGAGALGGMPGSQEELAASLEALTSNPAALRAAGKVASKMPPPDSLTGGTSGPASLPAGFGLLRRNRQKKDDEK